MTKTPTIEHVDPIDLVIGPNVRPCTIDDLDPHFIDSVRERGVIQPIVGYRDLEDGSLTVLMGQRRTLAACAAGLATIPMVVIEDPSEADRLLDQLTENEHRAGLSTADQINAISELALIGVPVSEIATQLATPAEQVETAMRAGSSPRVREIAPKATLRTLDELAALAEFDDDPETQQALADTDWNFAHKLQQARDKRAEAAAVARVTVDLEAAGETVVPYPADRWDVKSKTTTLDCLRGGGPKSHAKCPGRAIAIHVFWPWVNTKRELRVETVEVCTDWRANGHTHTSSRGKESSLSEEEQEKKTQERRATIANNKAWPAATEVRRQWLKEYFASTSPKRLSLEAVQWITTAIAANELDNRGRGLVEEWIGLPASGDIRNTSHLKGLSFARLEQIQHAIAVANREHFLDTKNGWRSWAGCGSEKARIEYLLHLEQCGYELSPVERLVAGYKAESQRVDS